MESGPSSKLNGRMRRGNSAGYAAKFGQVIRQGAEFRRLLAGGREPPSGVGVFRDEPCRSVLGPGGLEPGIAQLRCGFLARRFAPGGRRPADDGTRQPPQPAPDAPRRPPTDHATPRHRQPQTHRDTLARPHPAYPRRVARPPPRLPRTALPPPRPGLTAMGFGRRSCRGVVRRSAAVGSRARHGRDGPRRRHAPPCARARHPFALPPPAPRAGKAVGSAVRRASVRTDRAQFETPSTETPCLRAPTRSMRQERAGPRGPRQRPAHIRAGEGTADGHLPEARLIDEHRGTAPAVSRPTTRIVTRFTSVNDDQRAAGVAARSAPNGYDEEAPPDSGLPSSRRPRMAPRDSRRVPREPDAGRRRKKGSGLGYANPT